MRGRDTFGRERLRDLAEASTTRVLEPYPVDDGLRERWAAPGRTARDRSTPGLEMLSHEPLELADRDEPLTPRRLHGVNGGHDSAVDRRDADAEGLRRLPSAISQALGLASLAELVSASRAPPGCRDLM